ncbi:hypothetical protein ACNSPG_06460 [Brucella pituitosa]|uniref:hypothetical protein n=1 Tax=Brucella pituitosa TaxID=571256 RepID=UPI003C7355EB
MTIPDEAVQAAMEGYRLSLGMQFDEMMKDALTAALPFLQGVKVDSMDTAPKNGDEFLARCGKEWPWFSCFWDGSAFVHYDHTDGIVHYPATEWIPIPKRMLALAPSPRAQALEEGDNLCSRLEGLASWLDGSQHSKWCGRKEVPIHGYSGEGKLVRAAIAAIRALSSQPVADGLPQDVVNLVVAAREAWDTWQLPEEEFKRLDTALEAFASRVPYENEPEEDANDVSPSSGCVFRDMGVERPVADGWLPIDHPDLPDDGTSVILATTGGHVGEAVPPDTQDDDDDWYWCGAACRINKNHKPIAWRPLPASPEVSG